MSVKYAHEIVSEIEVRGPVQIPDGYVTGEDHEKRMFNQSVTGNSLLSNSYDDSNWDGE